MEFHSLPSTHDYAKEHLADLGDGCVLVARSQTGGRGSKGRSWVSDEGGLYFTLVLIPNFTPHLHNLTQLLCLSVCETARQLGVAAAVKWPNDVLVEGKKIAGVLSETIFRKNDFRALLLGAGVNVAQDALRVEGREVSSLRAEKCTVSPKEVLEKILQSFFVNYDAVLRVGFTAIRRDYLARLDGLGEVVSVDAGGEPLRGVMQTVSEEGKLIVVSEGNVVHEVLMGELLCSNKGWR